MLRFVYVISPNIIVMQSDSDNLLLEIGQLIKKMRAKCMDQTELGKRVGVSRTTISAIERGVGVNAKALFDVLAFLELTDVIRIAINQQLQIEDKGPLRKLRKPLVELSNDF